MKLLWSAKDDTRIALNALGFDDFLGISGPWVDVIRPPMTALMRGASSSQQDELSSCSPGLRFFGAGP